MLHDVVIVSDRTRFRQLQLFLWIIAFTLVVGTSQAAELPMGNPLPPPLVSAELPIPDNVTTPSEPASIPSIAKTKDRDGLWRDTGILVGAQVAAIGVLYAMPESVSGWSPQQKRNSLRNYEKNVQNPGIDNDKFYLNYILHPYWGATYYIRARERGYEEGESFLYSTAMSTLYEFGVECFFEKPSIQDMFVTPVIGSVIGRYLFEPVRARIKQKAERDWYDETLLVATDPIGVLSNGLEKMFGIKSQVELNYGTPAGSPRVDVMVKFQMR
jgi:hypothetical protein